MIWEDILLDADVPERELREALVASLGIASEELDVVDDMNHPSPVSVMVHKQRRGGQFPLMLSVYFKDGVRLAAPDVVFCRLSNSLGRRLLVAEDSSDPYVMRLVQGDQIEKVNLDVAALDERDEYILEKATHPDRL